METSKPDDQETPDLARRRLARGGIAGAAVLGSLISKPVLGSPLLNAPHHCTTSGQQSGNMSPRAGDDIACSTLGRSPAQWLAATDWPSAVTKGTLPTATGSYPFTGIGALFNGFLSLNTSFRYNSSWVTRSNTDNSGRSASMYSILAATTFNDSLAFEFGQETVAAILNSYQTVGAYPLSTTQVVAMYNAVYKGGLYQLNGTTQWNRASVIGYFRTLHP